VVGINDSVEDLELDFWSTSLLERRQSNTRDGWISREEGSVCWSMGWDEDLIGVGVEPKTHGAIQELGFHPNQCDPPTSAHNAYCSHERWHPLLRYGFPESSMDIPRCLYYSI